VEKAQKLIIELHPALKKIECKTHPHLWMSEGTIITEKTIRNWLHFNQPLNQNLQNTQDYLDLGIARATSAPVVIERGPSTLWLWPSRSTQMDLRLYANI